ncbi:MAG TPA: DAK2 domain-containing protein [Anaerolineales bacterium]|jgi:hypothetical protein
MPQSGLPLADIFQQVAKTLVENRQALNQADTINQDHGDNMVNTFQTIASSLEKKKGASDSAALAFAAKQLSRNGTGGSAQLYAQGLSQAATQLEGKQLDTRGAMQLLQTLIGGGQSAQPAGGDVLSTLMGAMGNANQNQAPQAPQTGGDDLLGALLGGLAGGQTPQQPDQQSDGGELLGGLLGGLAGGQPAPQAQGQQGSGDLIGSLLGGLAGGNTGNSTANNGLDMGDLLTAGMTFMQAKQSGQSNLQAGIQAFMAASGMGNSAHRSQSTQLVVSSFLKALGVAR